MRMARGITLSLLWMAGLAHSANVLIVSSGMLGQTVQNLTGVQANLGNAVTVLPSSQLPASLSAYQQVWDLGYNQSIGGTYRDQLAYYVQNGGNLFLMGENPGAAPTRNPAIVGFLNSLGAGSVVINGYGPGNETLASWFLLNNRMTAVTFSGSGTFAAVGNGRCISSGCTAADWPRGSLTNAPQGKVISVLDTNFLDAGYLQSAFVANLVENFNAAGTQPLQTSIPTLSRWGVGMTAILVAAVGFAAARRRRGH
ncbi:IPTL-CTERM sorting domain-containing protein [Paracidovorax cattleyae]|uniref:IPTL-CTERM protein sorting domain-containing protein n=1 Tax=Paracidovorax cattleyae TaxID=80868 RepID=A0A1H0WV98_9BURK|nr:IPTL-CTERM sorting domain-containing protein [Paracidovorax cattleyae]MBF9266036.1 IPTL-CTERM sorting domain-containing protein [Paracidovorax cattleyae]SDP94146.1 IPTL-CTERM protein sorting domain-containing protein [Paracidovorax cattleyae]